MSIYFFAIFISFLVNSLLIVPFINFLYKIKFRRAHQSTRDAFDKKTPIFDRFNKTKAGRPVGGGILTVILTVILYAFFLFLFVLFEQPLITNFPSFFSEIKIILFTFIAFALLGIYDDLNKIFFWKKKDFFGLRLRHKLIIEVILAGIVSWWLFNDLKIDIVHIPFFGVYNLSYFYILFSTFTIVAFANAVNITDGIDGLASGVLLITLLSFWVIAHTIIDVPTLLFIAVWIGGVIAFLYFNIYPARIFLGDSGALSFGATLAVIGLVLGKSFALPIIGGVFVIEITTSLVQLLSKKFFNRKVFAVAPFHLWLQNKNWDEPKIVMRLWVISILFSVFGLMIAFLK
ncbi:MAG: phospho-N-acetylmuramoyl-pentapeptide-transferase [Patescibacteria group bacterium]